MRTNFSKLLRATAGTAAYLLLLLAIYFVHMRYFQVDVVFYSVLLDVLAAAALGALLLVFLPYFSRFNPFEKAQLAAVWLLLGYIYAISIPTVIDRSLSFYMLEKMQQRGGGIRMDRFEDIFTKEYAREHQLVGVRLTEQQASGTLTIANGCVRLTERGQRLASFSRFFRKHLLPRKRLLMGSYTDQLTNPFRDSKADAMDMCERRQD